MKTSSSLQNSWIKANVNANETRAKRLAQCMLRGQRDQPRLCETPAKKVPIQMPRIAKD
jgi:hypothetical protein